MKTSFPRVCGGKLLLLATALVVVSAVGWLHAAENALLGNWFTQTEVAMSSGQTEKRGIVWKITGTSELTMCVASTETGLISTNPETWAVRRPDHSGDVAHGIYKLIGSDAFSTRIAGLPPDDIIWKRIAGGGKPARVPGCLLQLILPVSAANAGPTAHHPSLTGLWEASYMLNGLRRETVWRITPDGQSLRLDVEMRPMTYSASGEQLKVARKGEEGFEFTYHFAGKDTFETLSGDERQRWTRCVD